MERAVQLSALEKEDKREAEEGQDKEALSNLLGHGKRTRDERIYLNIIMLSKRQQGELQRSCPLQEKRTFVLQSTFLTVKCFQILSSA